MSKDARGADSDEYEEFYVLLDMDCARDLSFVNERRNYKIQNLQCQNPTLELDGTLFRGKYLDSIGTMLLFENKDGKASFVAKSHKQLRFVDENLHNTIANSTDNGS
mmetsp:Transcript_25312/g.44990  ORF Transcript_25312/g.44990 Transcript_25312/m.44990 type:complete len:107 (+) Transcript_25312:60-380(+)